MQEKILEKKRYEKRREDTDEKIIEENRREVKTREEKYTICNKII